MPSWAASSAWQTSPKRPETSQSAVSHQLRTLKQSHLVKFRRDGRNILYSLADDHVYTMLNQGIRVISANSNQPRYQRGLHPSRKYRERNPP